MAHISDQVAAELLAQGWTTQTDGYAKMIDNFAPAGSFSNGRRLVRVAMDPTGRWFYRFDGFGNVERDADLREYARRGLGPQAAILAVLA